MKKLLLIIPLIVLTQNLKAQYWQKIDSVFAPGGVTVQRFSAPEYADLDADGDFDLILGNLENEIEYFENLGGANPPAFKKDTSMFSSIYAGGYQYTNSYYPAVVDIDSDNDLDLIISGYNGLLFYKNIGDSSKAIWDERDTSFFSNVNKQIGTDAKPSFVDIDDDGDFDLIVGVGESLFGGPQSGISLGFRNIGTADSASFESDNTIVAGLPDVGINAYPAFADLDDDGDFDLLMGRDGAALYYYKNTGSAQSPKWSGGSTLFSNVETINYWKNPVFSDLDNDGDFDLTYGTDGGDLLYYENKGTAALASFIYNPAFFKVIKTEGSSTVSFADFDNDGDLDLLSGSTGGKLYYARNDGTSDKPIFISAATNFTTINPGFRSAPVFVNLDNDNDFDIASGYNLGKINYYINNGSSFTANPAFFDPVAVTYQSIPAFADIDADGDLDLLVGSDDANKTKFYLNDGNNSFSENTSIFSGVSFPRGSRPALADIDNDGDYDLFIGGTFGNINFYENTGDKFNPVWQLNNATTAEVKVKQAAHPGFADLDNDGRLDLIVGEYDGNFTFYKNLFALVGVEDDAVNNPTEFLLEQNYPNPFNPATIIKYSVPAVGTKLALPVQLKIYDVLGNEVSTLVNEVKSPGSYEAKFDASQLASGVYLYRISAGNFSSTRKMILLR